MTNRSRLQTTTLAAVLALSGCSTVGTKPGSNLAEMPAGGGLTVLTKAVEVFAKDLVDSAEHPEDKTKAHKAYRSGLSALDLQCERYLDAVGLANQAATNERKQTALAGGLLASLMGLTGSTSKQVAGVAAGFSFAGSSLDAYTTSYLFSDAAKSVTRVVRQSQDAYLGALSYEPDDLDYPTIVRLLTGYEAVCRPAQIRALIDDAIAKSRVVSETPPLQAVDAEVGAVLEALAAEFGQRFNEAEAIVLYAWLTNTAERKSNFDAREPVASLKKRPMTDEELARRLGRSLLSVSLAGSAVAQRWAGPVQSLRAVAAAPAPAASGARGLPPPPPVQPARKATVRTPILTTTR